MIYSRVKLTKLCSVVEKFRVLSGVRWFKHTCMGVCKVECSQS